jgi:hypothetical protein
VALTLGILAVPAWLFADDLRYFVLVGDDFAYIANSRDWSITRAHLLAPHNTHVVPLWRLWTFALVVLSGRLEAMPSVFRAATYLGLVAPMVVVGHLAAREAGQPAVGLAAMAGLGISTVMKPVVTWYSAGQALWAGAAIVLTVALAREWSLKGGGWRLGLTGLAALAAPAIWTGGLIAGPAAIAYLWAGRPSRSLGTISALAGVSAAAVLVLLVVSRRQITQTGIIWERHPELWPRPVQSLLHTAQGVVEALVLGNLGLDSVTTPMQAAAILTLLIGLWAWSRGGLSRVNPLEAAGATVVLGGYYLVYFFRGNLPFSSLRPVTWYHAIPQVGALVFAAGWWVALRPAGASGRGGLTRRGALAVIGVVVAMVALQVPRGARMLLLESPPMSASEKLALPTPLMRRLRALYFKEEFHGRQLRALARLDKADRLAWQLGAGPETLRRVFGRVLVPGIPPAQIVSDAVGLLLPPPDNPSAPPDPDRLHLAFDDLFRTEPELRPAWLHPDEPWPR